MQVKGGLGIQNRSTTDTDTDRQQGYNYHIDGGRFNSKFSCLWTNKDVQF